MNFFEHKSKSEWQMDISRRWKDVAKWYLKEYDVHTVSGFVRYMIRNREERFGNPIKSIYIPEVPMFKETMISILKEELPGFPVTDMVELFMKLYKQTDVREIANINKLLYEFELECKIMSNIPVSFFNNAALV